MGAVPLVTADLDCCPWHVLQWDEHADHIAIAREGQWLLCGLLSGAARRQGLSGLLGAISCQVCQVSGAVRSVKLTL